MQIYQILNTVTGKSYIGKSTNHERRFKRHLAAARNRVYRRLYDSINKHGSDNFTLILLEDLGDCSTSHANSRESYWIREFGSIMPNGYNMTSGGDGGATLENWSEEDRSKLYRNQAETRKARRKANPLPPEYFDLRSEITKEKWRNMTDVERGEISTKISATLTKKYESGEIVATTPPPKYGGDNWNYVDVNEEELLHLIKRGKNSKEISCHFNTSWQTIWAKLKLTGKTYREWRKYYANVEN